MPNFKPSRFKRLYVEEAVANAPLTQVVRERMRPTQEITIRDYRDVFARPGQDFAVQKQAPAILLAHKKDNLVYPGNAMVQEMGYANFAYTAQVLNCLYDCGYCYLQGMYPSANVVIFTNQEDYFAAVDKAIATRPDPTQPLHLAISYDTDLLGFESIIPLCREWIEFTRSRPDLIIEIRTKSANFRAIESLPACDRVILAWTLSPETVIREHEALTPSLARRLSAAQKAQTAGWPLRLCFDPVLHVPGWESLYAEMIETTFAQLAAEQVVDVSLGVFRVGRDYYKTMRAQRRSPLMHSVLDHRDSTVSYPADTRDALLTQIRARLALHLSPEKVHTWM